MVFVVKGGAERGYLSRLVCYLPRLGFERRYKIYNPIPARIRNTPKANKPPPKSATLEIITRARPPTIQAPGTLRVITLKLKFIGGL